MDRQQIDYFYQIVQESILSKQNIFTGLIPASDNTNDAWVRDNVYASLSAWALAMAYKKIPDDDSERSRCYELEQCVVKLMRGILRCYMMQKVKVERFKHSQDRHDSLHAKFDARTCEPVVGDSEWGHLQIDAVSLFILMLAQMTESGLRIVWSVEEVAFIQNLVFYIELAYRIPDYGIWERGDKTNHGLPELNSSSVGMAKAALEAIDELDLFGSNGGPASTIHVFPDETKQCSTVIENMLPRESNSKEIDSAVLGIISFPAFAVDDENLVNKTRSAVLTKLLGSYGCKRFLRDGFRTPLEDPSRLYYEPWELRRFEGIECEWPMFFAYLVIDAIFMNENDYASKYLDQLEQVVIRQNPRIQRRMSLRKSISLSGSSSPGAPFMVPLMPESYNLSSKRIDAELVTPHSQPRDPVGKLPHIWGQSLYILANLLQQGLVLPGEIDPLGRRMVTEPKPDLSVQVVVVAENDKIKGNLLEYGLEVQTFAEVFAESGIRIYPAKVLSQLYKQLGCCPKLQLTGRSNKDIGILATSRFYRVANNTVAFTPQFIDHHAFYLSLDIEFILDNFRTSVAYLRRAWNSPGRPLLLIPVYDWFFQPVYGSRQPALVSTIKKLRSGYINGTRVILDTLKNFEETACITRLSFLKSTEALDLNNSTHTTAESIVSRRLSPASVVPKLSRCEDERSLSVEAELEGFQRSTMRRKSMVLAQAVFTDLSCHHKLTSVQEEPARLDTSLSRSLSRRRTTHPRRAPQPGDRRMSLFTGIMTKATSDWADEEAGEDEDSRADNYDFTSDGTIDAKTLLKLRRLHVGSGGIDAVDADSPQVLFLNFEMLLPVKDLTESSTHLLLLDDEGVNKDDKRKAKSAALRRIVSQSKNGPDQKDEQVARLHKISNAVQQTMNMLETMQPEAIVERLMQSDTLAEQAEMLGQLKQSRGLEWDTGIDSNNPITVRVLLKEVYERASVTTSWFILRYTAGLLGKRVDTLAKSLTDILVLQKQVTVGLPPEPREKVITTPLAPKQIADLIQQTCGDDSLFAMLTQEILVYLAMIARTRPQLLSQMLRLRIGLIIQMMASELARTMPTLNAEDAIYCLFSMSPFETKRLLYTLLSGKELRTPASMSKTNTWRAGATNRMDMQRSSGVRPAALMVAAMSLDEKDPTKMSAQLSTDETVRSEAPSPLTPMHEECQEEEEEIARRSHSQWSRRRKIDGALNRVPYGFFECVYTLLERVSGLRIGSCVLNQNITKEMTRGEVKFALKVEAFINTIATPEFRQLLMEATLVLGSLIMHDVEKNIKLNSVISVEDLVAQAHRLFLEDQLRFEANATLCCAKKELLSERVEGCGPHQICQRFYDTPPAGRYGTMSYMVRALSLLVRDSAGVVRDGKLLMNCALQ